MKKSYSFLIITFFGIAVFLLFANVECNEGSNTPELPSKCGEKVSKSKVWDASIAGSLNPAAHFTSVHNEIAYYGYSIPSVENVCCHRHVIITFTFIHAASLVQDTYWSADVTYGVLHSFPIHEWSTSYDSETKNYTTTATVEFGMTDLYGDDPGWFLPVAELGVKDLGSPDQNNEFFMTAIKKITIEYTYYKWKAN